jgi:hypothetical protein
MVIVGRDMKARRLLALASAAIVVVLAAVLALSAYWEHKQPVFTNASKLMAALQAFSKDRVTHGLQLPREISLQDLVAGGYLTTNDVAAFDGMDVTFFGQSSDGSPPPVLAVARPRTDHKQVTCLLSDGSVAGWTHSRYEDMLRNAGQRDGAANGSQPIRLETNRTSSAAGSRR